MGKVAEILGLVIGIGLIVGGKEHPCTSRWSRRSIQW